MMTGYRNLTRICLAAVLAFGLAACGGGGTEKSAAELEMERLAAEEAACTSAGGRWNDDNTCTSATQLAAEAAAAAEEAGCTAGGGRWNDDDTCTSADDLAAERAAAEEAERMAEEAAARQALVTAAMCDDATEACIAHHDALIAALQGDVAALAEDDDATNAQQVAAQMAVDDAQDTRKALQMKLDDANMATETGMKVAAATTAANALEEDRSATAIQAAKEAIEVARMAVGEDDSYDARLDGAQMAVDRAEERNEVDSAVMMAKDAADGLTDDSSVAAVTAAQARIDAAEMAVSDAEHLSAAEKTAHNSELMHFQRSVDLAKARNDDEAEKQRMAEEEEERKANEAMAVTARKLYTGISAQMGAGDGTDFASTDRDAFYNSDATAILVSIGNGTDIPSAVSATLSEDKKTTVAALHGWTGKRYADPAGGDSYEAFVYSNVEAPKMGKKFGSATAVPTDEAARAAFGYQYQLDAADRDGNANKALTIDTAANANYAALISLSGVTRTAGTETFHLPDGNPEGEQFISVPGTFHGVSGTFSCQPSTPANGCTAAVASTGGFTLAGGTTWLFIPSNAEAQVTDAVDTAYASYGWWLHKNEAESVFTASAFVDEKGTVSNAANIDALNGTATYVGGAAGKYALSSSTGGTNDAGHFAARATLEADFSVNDGTNTTGVGITGTIDQFIGADGESRDWSVKLNGSPITNTGGIGDAGDATPDNAKTVWTIGGQAGNASGNWTGNLRNNGADGIPQVATGTFYSVFGRANEDGKMVGAFGANLDD